MLFKVHLVVTRTKDRIPVQDIPVRKHVTMKPDADLLFVPVRLCLPGEVACSVQPEGEKSIHYGRALSCRLEEELLLASLWNKLRA